MKLQSFNIPDITLGDADISDISLRINPEDDPNKRFFVFMPNGPLEQLKDITHTPDSIRQLNKDSIHFYLFEPLSMYCCNGKVYNEDINSRYTQGYYSEFSYPTRLQDIRSSELDSILEYKRRNNIDDGVIQVHSCEYRIAETMPYYNTELMLLCDDMFVKTIIVHSFESEADAQFNKHFIALNWRYTKHRQLLANFLAGENGYLSWYFKNEFTLLADDLYFDLDSWETTHPTLYKQLQDNNKNIIEHGPYSIDKPSAIAKDITHPYELDMWPGVEGYNMGETPSRHNPLEKTLREYYQDIFVDIVTETRFAQPQGTFSEKLLQPIQYMKPFIVLAPPYTLEYLRTYGYQTFGDFWDEGYDSIEDHSERLAAIFTLIQSILSKSIEELREVYKNMIPVLEHNNQIVQDSQVILRLHQHINSVKGGAPP